MSCCRSSMSGPNRIAPQTVAVWAMSAFVGLFGCSPNQVRHSETSGPAVTPGEATLIVEIREDYSEKRTLLALEHNDLEMAPRPATEAESAAFEAFRMDCRQRSMSAFDKLRSITGNQVPKLDLARKALRVIPNPAGTYAVLMGLYPRVDSILDMRTGEVVETPPELGSKLYGPVAWCRNGKQLALRAARAGSSEAIRLVVLDVPRMAIDLDLDLGPSVQEVAWRGNCEELGVLVRKTRDGKGPIERLGAALGHGVFYSDFRVLLVSLKAGLLGEVSLVEGVRYGSGTIAWDHGSVASLASDALAGRITGEAAH